MKGKIVVVLINILMMFNVASIVWIITLPFEDIIWFVMAVLLVDTAALSIWLVKNIRIGG